MSSAMDRAASPSMECCTRATSNPERPFLIGAAMPAASGFTPTRSDS